MSTAPVAAATPNLKQGQLRNLVLATLASTCLLYTSPSPRD